MGKNIFTLIYCCDQPAVSVILFIYHLLFYSTTNTSSSIKVKIKLKKFIFIIISTTMHRWVFLSRTFALIVQLQKEQGTLRLSILAPSTKHPSLVSSHNSHFWYVLTRHSCIHLVNFLHVRYNSSLLMLQCISKK